jgi:dephospho-CoA kinase
MFAGKPIIGVTGGIGSGKSFVGKLFGELGCLVFDSDEQVRQAYQREDVKRTLREWWGDGALDASGQVNRKAVAQHVFQRPQERRRLEQLLHPLIAQQRDRLMAASADDAQVLAYVWDAPLLFEAGLAEKCDAVVFVEAPLELRLERVLRERGWERDELLKREKSQLPLDKKRGMSDHMVLNTADADYARTQVRDVFSRILAAGESKRGPK